MSMAMMTVLLAISSGAAIGGAISLVLVWRAMFMERRKLLAIISDMNREAVMIYHCASGRCSKCWGNAKAAHDIALNAFEARGLPPPT